MIVMPLTEHRLKILSLIKGCRGSSESTHVKMPHCSKSLELAHILLLTGQGLLESMWILVKISKADWSALKRLLLLHV